MTAFFSRFAFLSVLAALTWPGAETPARAEEPAPVAVQAGRLIDPASGQVKTGQMLLIQDGIIVSVTDAARADIPADAKVIDLSDATVLPELIDVHVHLTRSHNVHGYRRLGVSVQRAAITGVANAQRTAMAGFTTVRNVGVRP